MPDGQLPGGSRPSARPDESLVSRLQIRLRAVAPTAFAGIAIEPDRSITVYATVVEPALSQAIAEVQTQTPGGVPVRVTSGIRNSLATLEDVRDRITARARDLVAQGVSLTEWGPDIRANRVRIGVHGLTPAIAAALEREFGADRILVVEGVQVTAV